MAMYDPKQLEEYAEAKVKEALHDLNKWYVENEDKYCGDWIWFYAKKYLQEKYKMKLKKLNLNLNGASEYGRDKYLQALKDMEAKVNRIQASVFVDKGGVWFRCSDIYETLDKLKVKGGE